MQSIVSRPVELCQYAIESKCEMCEHREWVLL